ncbi:MAG: hypothetical protein QCH31_11775 [Methanolobus sp.]|nr:hypothetical protein [Methanolobus sp.]
MYQIPADRPADPGQAIIPARPYTRSTLPAHSHKLPHYPGLPILRIAPAICRNISFFPVCPDRPRLLVIIRQVWLWEREGQRITE